MRDHAAVGRCAGRTWSVAGSKVSPGLDDDHARRTGPTTAAGVVQVRVVDERAGVRRREAHHEAAAGSIIGVSRGPMPLKPWTPS